MRDSGGLWLAVTLGLFLSSTALGDTFPESSYPNFAEDGEFDPAISAPSSVLGYRLGARPAGHRQVLQYLRTLASESPRAQLTTYGQTHEGRDLVVLIVSSEDNMACVEEIQADMARLSDPRSVSQAEQRELIETLPTVCWMAYTIHGDELSGSDAALAFAYRLVAGQDTEAQEIRDNVITIIDPLQNPDGRERFLAQIYAFNGKVPNPDTQSLAHTGLWPWGRGNHYYFDLNRDWFPLAHPESRGRLRLLTSWHPQLVVDGHEMGAFDTYLFSPPREPFNPYMTPQLLKWWERFAQDQADALDRYGWSYYTREWNEEWYPGYGSTWAVYTGAIGILYEQAGTEGTVIKRPDGTVLNYGEAVHHQYVSSMANVLTAARSRKDLLSDYVAQREGAVRLGTNGMVKAFLFPPGDDPERTQRLMETLVLQGIEVHRAASPVTARSLRDPWGNTWASKTFAPGTYVVSLSQPDARVARTIMDFHLQMPDSFLVSEREYLERQKGTRLYEITAWAVTLAYGVPVYWAGQAPDGSLERVTSFDPLQGGLESPEAEYGYVMDGSSDASIRAVAKLLSEGFVVRTGLEEFTVEGHSYPRGSFLLRRDANPDELSGHLDEICKDLGVTARGVGTARAAVGPDLGGNRFRALAEPRIAVLAGNPISFNSTGSLWYLLDHEMEMRVSLLTTDRVRNADLGKYNVIVLPRAWGGPSGYRRYLGESGTAKLRSWVESGGTLIAIRSGAAFLADSSAHMSAVRLRRDVVSKYPPPIWGLDLETAKEIGLFQATGVALEKEESGVVAASPTTGLGIPGPGSPILGPGALPFAGAGRSVWTPPPAKAPTFSAEEWAKVDARMRRFQPQGAYLRVDMDPDHWLTAGLPEKVPSMVTGSYAFVAEDPVRTVARFAAPESLHVAGLLWPEAAARLAHTAFMTHETIGRGQVILMAVDPYFRAYHHAVKRLFLNAAVLGPGMGTARTVPW